MTLWLYIKDPNYTKANPTSKHEFRRINLDREPAPTVTAKGFVTTTWWIEEDGNGRPECSSSE